MRNPRQPARTIEAEVLLAHSAWLARLARALVARDDEIDDVVQQTFAQALAQPPRHTGNIRAWLATIARNVVRSKARSDVSRIAREVAAAPPPPIEGPAEAVERAELRQRVVNSVLALDEPYRSTVILRFFEEMDVGAISRLTETGEDTVRTRIRRGIIRLRERLEHEVVEESRYAADGGAAARALLFFQLRRIAASGGNGGAMTPVARSGIWMRAGRTAARSTARRVLVGAATLSIVAGGWWWSHSSRSNTSSPPTEVAGGGKPVDDASRRAPVAAAPAVERQPDVAPPTAAPAPTAAVTHLELPPLELGTIRGRITDPDGVPVPHARVFAIASPSFDRPITLAKFAFNAGDWAIEPTIETLYPGWVATETGDDGRYEIGGLLRVTGWTIGALAEEAGAMLGDVTTFDHAHGEAFVDLKLVAGRYFHGIVRDESHAPLGNALVKLSATVGKETSETRYVTIPYGEGVGEFDAGFVCGEPLVCSALAKGYGSGDEFQVRFMPHKARTRIVISLHRPEGIVVRGRIVDRYGNPADIDALLAKRLTDFNPVQRTTMLVVRAIPDAKDPAAPAGSEVEGRIDYVARRYDLVIPNGFRGRVELSVAGTVVGSAPLTDPSAAPDVPCDFERLPQAGAATTFRARFVDADSKQPIDLTGLEPPNAYYGEGIRAVARESGSDPRQGIVEYGCLAGELVFDARFRGYELSDLRVVVPEGSPAGPQALELHHECGAIRGVVFHSDGRPFRKSRLVLLRLDAKGEVETTGARVSTNPDGEFVFPTVAKGEHFVVASGLPDEAPRVAHFVVDSATQRIELRCVAGMMTRFRVAAESGKDTPPDTRFRVVDGSGVTIADSRGDWPLLPNHSNDFSTVLAAGRYRIVITRRGFQVASREFTVPAGDAVAVQLEPVDGTRGR